MTLPCSRITTLQQIADLGFQAPKGKRPATGDKPVTVLFRNGWVSKNSYRADQIRWTIDGHDWDAVGYR